MSFKKKIMKFNSLALASLIVALPVISNANEVNSNEQLANTNEVSSSEQLNENEVIENRIKEIKDNGFKYEINKNLSEDEIYKRLEDIDSKYDLYEPCSPEDSEFILGYQDTFGKNSDTQNESTFAINQNMPIRTVKKSAYGVTAQFSGSIFQRGAHGLTNLSNEYGGKLYLKILGGASKVNQVKGEIFHTAWGLAGPDGLIWKVYDNKVTYTKSKAPFASSVMDEIVHYRAATGAMSTYAKMTVYADGGSFYLSGNPR